MGGTNESHICSLNSHEIPMKSAGFPHHPGFGAPNVDFLVTGDLPLNQAEVHRAKLTFDIGKPTRTFAEKPLPWE